MIRRPPRSTLDRSSAASDVYKRQIGKPFFGERGDIQLVEIKNKNDKIGLVDLNGKLILECALSLIHISEPTRPY